MTEFYFEQQNNLVIAKIKSDVSVNTWSGSVFIPSGIKIENIVTGQSVTEIWQTIPRFENNEIIFAGGKPNGFNGDGIIFKIVLDGDGRIEFSSSTKAYLNNGLGSDAQASISFLDYSLGDNSLVGIKDNNPPEAFMPQLFQQKDFFDNKQVVIFGTDDKESGINRYEVKEITKDGVIDWHKAESPYVLNEGVKEIQIKAVDNFGNERIEALSLTKTFNFEYEMFFIFVIGVIVIAYIIRKWKTIRKLKNS